MTTYIRRRPKRLDIYTDGACSGPGGAGGWAWAVLELLDGQRFQDSGGEASTTNQRMEMMAAIQALEAVKPKARICICTDSAYVMNCFEQKWYLGWEKRGWINSQGKPVANKDLWIRLIVAVMCRDVAWRKVKGHSGDQGNDLVDQMAVLAKKRFMK